MSFYSTFVLQREVFLLRYSFCNTYIEFCLMTLNLINYWNPCQLSGSINVPSKSLSKISLRKPCFSANPWGRSTAGLTEEYDSFHLSFPTYLIAWMRIFYALQLSHSLSMSCRLVRIRLEYVRNIRKLCFYELKNHRL